MKFNLTTEYKLPSKIRKKFKLIVNMITQLEKISPNVLFEVSIISNNKIKEINYKYRKLNKPTDVITFSFWDNVEIKTDLLGEIFISYEQAVIQSKEFNHSFEREICFLLVHGIFHLLGYDHIEKAAEKIMFEKQKLIMNKFF